MSKPVKESVGGKNSAKDVIEDQQPVDDVTIVQESADDVINGQTLNDATNGETSVEADDHVEDDSSFYDVTEDSETDSDVTDYYKPGYHATDDQGSDDDFGADPGSDADPLDRNATKEANRKKFLKNKRKKR